MYFQLERMIDDFQNQKSGPNFGPLRAVLTIFGVERHLLDFWHKIWPSLVKYYRKTPVFWNFQFFFVNIVEVV